MPESSPAQLAGVVSDSSLDELLQAHRAIWENWCLGWQREQVERFKHVLEERAAEHKHAA